MALTPNPPAIQSASPPATPRALLNTQESPQPLSHQTIAHTFRDTPGWGSVLAARHSSQATPTPRGSVNSASRRSLFLPLSSPSITPHRPSASTCGTRSTSHASPCLSTMHGKPFRMCSSVKNARNSLRMRTSKTKNLKPCRMNTSEKTPGGWARTPLVNWLRSQRHRRGHETFWGIKSSPLETPAR
jgi:hypothetical protein